jgi:hypothetical protein
MNWLKRKMRRWLQEEDCYDNVPIATVRSNDIDMEGLAFSVMPARGGTVVQIRQYDRQKDRSHNGLYIITNDQDFGHEIDKIITMEALK